MATNHTLKDFLDAIFRPYYKQKTGFVLVRTSARNEIKTGSRYFPNSDGLSREQYSEETNVFFGVCPREKMKPGKEHVGYITCLWAGLDIGPDGYSGKEKHFASEKQAMMAIMAFPLKPSIIVQSGRGMHLYWLLKQVTEISIQSDFEKLLNRIANYFQCSASSGLDAVLRLPETWNSKNQIQSTKCFVERLDPTLRYDIEEFEDLDLRIIIPSKRAPRMPQVKLPAPVRISVVDSHAAVRNDAFRDRHSHGVASTRSQSEEDATTEVEEISEEEGTFALDDESMKKIADMMIDRFSDRILERLADRVAEKVLRGLLNTGGE
ncbi:MAG: hypothetical protein HY912_06190 [Desulfomonile tiedjei]|uniref:RepB-like DNA primase domain-containing protein n=1 Tax=Desulfomonile tiedjei TaxID=2358 RepID=A0A9D6V4L8_9BACT|nr:hypothetical protein [Desulfomonile tiedjei]